MENFQNSFTYTTDILFCLTHYGWLGSSGFQDRFGPKYQGDSISAQRYEFYLHMAQLWNIGYNPWYTQGPKNFVKKKSRPIKNTLCYFFIAQKMLLWSHYKISSRFWNGFNFPFILKCIPQGNYLKQYSKSAWSNF